MRSSLIGDESAVTGSAGQASASTPPLPEEENRMQQTEIPSAGVLTGIADLVRRGLQSEGESHARQWIAMKFAAREWQCIADVLSRFSALQAENASAKTERDDALAEADHWRDQLVARNREFDALQAENAALRAERDEAKGAAREACERLEETHESLSIARNGLTEASGRTYAAEARLSALQERVERGEGERDQAVEALKGLLHDVLPTDPADLYAAPSEASVAVATRFLADRELALRAARPSSPTTGGDA